MKKKKSVTLIRMIQYWLMHIDVKDAIIYTVMTLKHYYNLKHKSLYFKTEDLVNLCLYTKATHYSV